MPLNKNGSNIFFLSSTLKTGGAEKVIETLALNISGYGFNPTVVCLHQPGKIGSNLAEQGVEVNSGVLKGKTDLFSVFRLARLLRKGGCRLLFSLDHHDAMFLGAIASVLAGIRHRVIAMHSTGLWGRKSKFKLTDRLVFPLYSRIIGLADAHIEYLRETEGIPEDKIIAINNGIDTGRFRPPESREEYIQLRDELNIPPDNFVVTMLAVLRPEKNHQLLLNAAAGILDKSDGISFLIVGQGEEAAKLQHSAIELGIEGEVRFLGMRDDVPEILRISDVSVLCSYPVVETFPLSVLESFSSGVPVIATSVGSLTEMVEDKEDGILIESDDLEGLVEALLFLYHHDDVRRQMGKKGRKKAVEKYSQEKMLEKYAEMFDRLVSAERDYH